MKLGLLILGVSVGGFLLGKAMMSFISYVINSMEVDEDPRR